MESIVEDVEDQRQNEGSPAISQSGKNLVGFDVLKPSDGIHQWSCIFIIHSQLDDDIDSEAKSIIK